MGTDRCASVALTCSDVPNLRAEGGTIPQIHAKGNPMNSIVYLVGAVVIIVAILAFFGLG
jgi:hypothetical protein